MVFDSFASAHSTVLWTTFFIAVIMGAVVNKTNFCTMGAVSDWVNIGDTGRFRAWLFALAIAMLGVAIFESMSLFSTDMTRPPYRGVLGPTGNTTFPWLEYVLGGIMFGVGMTLGSGCGNKTLIRLGAGNIKSLFVFLIIAVCAYYMINPFSGDKTLYSELFYYWTNPTAMTLGSQQDLGSLLGGYVSMDKNTLRLIIAFILSIALLAFVFKSQDFRGSFDNILGGAVVGIAVLLAWYASGALASVNADGEIHTWVKYASNDVWDLFETGPSTKPRAVGVQSYTFINPIGETLGYAANGFNKLFLTFGVMAVFGVICGSLIWSLISKSFRIEWFASVKDFVVHAIGGILMGIGGILSLGCTIGQAITGASTLALGSFIAFASIVVGCAVTMKIQYQIMLRSV